MLDSLFTAVRTLGALATSIAPLRTSRQSSRAVRTVGTLGDRPRPTAGSRGAACTVEPLEERQLMSVVYVSHSTGNDHNSGTSANSPVASLARANKLTHSGDTLLLKCGDSWNEAIGDWNKPNTTVGSYGSGARPKVVTGGDAIFLVTASNVTLRGISFNGTGGTTHTGITLSGKNSNVVIDNCEVKGFRMNIAAQGWYAPIHNLTIRNSLITDANGNGMSSGLYADKVQGLRLENNDFEHNGGHGSIFNHGAYVTGLCSGLVATGNTFAYSSNYGMQARCGGVITNNTFKCNSVGLSIGLVNGSGTHTDGGVAVTVTGNTFTGVGVGLHAGLGIEAGNIKSGTISNNKFTNGTGIRYAACISISRGTAGGQQVGVNNLTISNNVNQNWGGKGVTIAADAGVRNLVQSNNKL